MKQVFVARTPTEAHLVKGVLETHGSPHNRNRCSKGEPAMTMVIKAFAVVVAGTALATSAFAVPDHDGTKAHSRPLR